MSQAQLAAWAQRFKSQQKAVLGDYCLDCERFHAESESCPNARQDARALAETDTDDHG